MQRVRPALRERLLLIAWIITIAVGTAARDDASDALWMAREGIDVLHGSPIVHPDHWSWSPVPNAFVPTSPGWDVALGLAWQVDGRAGMFILTVVNIALSLGAIAFAARTAGASTLATTGAVLIGSWAAGPLLGSRASLPALALLMIAIGGTWRVLRHNLSAGSAALLIVLLDFGTSNLGMWLHGSWTAWAPVSAGAALWLAWNARSRSVGQRLAIGIGGAAAAIAGALLGPLGTMAWSNAMRVSAVSRGRIIEWMTPWQVDFGERWLWIGSVTLVLLLAIRLLRRHRRNGNFPLQISFTLLGLGGVAAGAIAMRFLLLGIVLAIPLLAVVISGGPARARIRSLLGERAEAPYWRIVLALLLIPIVPAAMLATAVRPWQSDPVLAALPSHCRLFSTDTAAKQIPLLRPDVRVWFDGRQDYWGIARMEAVAGFLQHRQPNTLVPAGTTCVMLERAHAVPLAGALDDSRRWRRVAASDAFIVWVAATAAPLSRSAPAA